MPQQQAQATAEQPRLQRDPMRGYAWVDTWTGQIVSGPPPTQRYRYKVGEKSIRIESCLFEPGVILGEGNIKAHYPEVWLCEFTPAEGIDPELVNAGRIAARLRDGLILAEPLED